MAQLDRSRPFDRVYGTPGAVFSQDGKTFNAGGKEVRIVSVPGDEETEEHTVARVIDPEQPAPGLGRKRKAAMPLSLIYGEDS